VGPDNRLIEEAPVDAPGREELSGVPGVISFFDLYALVSWIVPDEHFRLPETREPVKEFSTRAGHPGDREFMSTGSPLCSTRLFVRSTLTYSGFVHTNIPLTGSRNRLLSFLPEEAGPR
jgi:hypothetical protein